MRKQILRRGKKKTQYYISIPKKIVDSNLLMVNQFMNLFTDEQIKARNLLIVELINSFYKKEISGEKINEILKLILDLNIANLPTNIQIIDYIQLIDKKGYLVDFIDDMDYSIKEDQIISIENYSFNEEKQLFEEKNDD